MAGRSPAQINTRIEAAAIALGALLAAALPTILLVLR